MKTNARGYKLQLQIAILQLEAKLPIPTLYSTIISLILIQK